MNAKEVLEAVANILKQYKEEDIDGEPIPVDCEITFAGSCRYKLYGDKFDNLRHNYDPTFLDVVKELKDKGYSVGYGATLKSREVINTDYEYHITIYGPDAGFNEYKGYKVGYRINPPTFI